MPLRMEGASKKKREGYCSHEALCLPWLCENASLSLCYEMHSGENSPLYIVLIRKKSESWQNQCCCSIIMRTGLWGKDLQEEALLKLILVIHTRIQCVILAVPAWHGGIFPAADGSKKMCPGISGKRRCPAWFLVSKPRPILSYLIIKEVNIYYEG